MTTQPYEVRGGGRPAVQASEFPRQVLRGWSLDSPFGTTGGWTDAHSEAARFVGECFAFGAVCGFVVEMARSTRRLTWLTG